MTPKESHLRKWKGRLLKKVLFHVLDSTARAKSVQSLKIAWSAGLITFVWMQMQGNQRVTGVVKRLGNSSKILCENASTSACMSLQCFLSVEMIPETSRSDKL
jgi:hypothetical protein